MNRGKPLTRRTRLEPGGPIVRKVGLKPKSAARSGRRATALTRPSGPDAHTVDYVLQRDHWSCRVCDAGLVGTRGWDWSIHHLRRRSQGGDHHHSNLISVCGNGVLGCHGRIHAFPQWARDNGFLLGREAA